jgi:uncharacterized protein with ATP-grasp and redox domains
MSVLPRITRGLRSEPVNASWDEPLALVAAVFAATVNGSPEEPFGTEFEADTTAGFVVDGLELGGKVLEASMRGGLVVVVAGTVAVVVEDVVVVEVVVVVDVDVVVVVGGMQFEIKWRIPDLGTQGAGPISTSA